MSLIKNAQSDRLLNDAVMLDFSDLTRNAQSIVENARRQSRQILESARREAGAIIERAETEGFEKGRSQGLAQGSAEGEAAARRETVASLSEQLGLLTQSWTDALQQWERDRADLLHAAREDVLRLAIELAAHIVHRHVKTDPAQVIDQVAHSLALIAQPSRVEICIHPDDRAVLQDVLPGIVEGASNVRHAELRDDDAVNRGGCVIRTERGRIDATIRTQLRRVAEALLPGASTESSPGDGEGAA